MDRIWDATMNTARHQRVAGNIEGTAEATEQLNSQMSMLWGISLRLLAVQQQLYVQDQIRSLTQQQLAVSQEQPVLAMKTVQRLDITNQRLAGIDASLADISGLLVQLNALIQKSLHRLVIEAQELIGRTDQERAARDQHRQQLGGEIAGTVPPPAQPPDQPIIGGEIGEPGSREEPKDTGGPGGEHPDPFLAALARGEEIPFAQPVEPEPTEDELAAQMSGDAGTALAQKDKMDREQWAQTLETRPDFRGVMTSGADDRIALTVST